jgi:ribonuclease PH
MPRIDGRSANQLRPVRLTPGFMPFAEGSVLIEMGQTRVICAASVEESVPAFMRGRGQGWLTAEYRMLPRATNTRTTREGLNGGLSGRTQEIQRLIGRSLRGALDFAALGERTIVVDCDVLQADGGTRTASITGGYVALALALRRLRDDGRIASIPLRRSVAAISVGLVDGAALLDLCYAEDSRAEVDANVVLTDEGDVIEFQTTAEGAPLPRRLLGDLLDLADIGTRELRRAQSAALER